MANLILIRGYLVLEFRGLLNLSPPSRFLSSSIDRCLPTFLFLLTLFSERDTFTLSVKHLPLMERKALIVCCVVGFLGLLAAATSFAAEATRIKVSVFRSCLFFLEYPSTKVSIFCVISSSMSVGSNACACHCYKGMLLMGYYESMQNLQFFACLSVYDRPFPNCTFYSPLLLSLS